MYTVTATGGRVVVSGANDHARVLTQLLPERVLEDVVAFVLDGGRGSVVLTVKDKRVQGVRIDAIVM